MKSQLLKTEVIVLTYQIFAMDDLAVLEANMAINPK